MILTVDNVANFDNLLPCLYTEGTMINANSNEWNLTEAKFVLESFSARVEAGHTFVPLKSQSLQKQHLKGSVPDV